MLDDPSCNLRDRLNDAGLLPGRGDFAGEGRLAVRDPATGEPVAQVAVSDAAGAQAAVDAAEAAFAGWAGMLPQDRAAILHRWHALILGAKEDLARIMVAEQGKPVSEARGEIGYAASFVQFYAEEALRPNIEGVTSHLPDAEMELWREPVGVAALVTPWNFPSAMITRKAAAALGAGCTVVIHPSAETPLSALALAELARRAGFPEGVVNTVIGDAATIVGEWTADTRVRALSFTGSTEVGRLLYRQSADTVKRLVLELGGHAPFIVFKGADMERAVAEAVKAKFATSGQDCLGANRFYVQRPVYDEFCARFTEAVEKLTLGPGLQDPDIGPLIHDRAIAKQIAHIDDAVARGARVLTGGGVAEELGPLFFHPTLLADVPDAAAIMREETFGPVAPLSPFDEEDEVIARANATEYGLVAYVHSLDPRRIYRMTRALQYGMVAVNRTKVTGAPIPFGGMKQSGIGREGARQGLEAFTEIKYVCRDWA
ncbi:NAD-dependent succinate-semialdehyde dehydrogenase [Paracoccus siganidrum]|uniref:NAD-dependent succinate-semialdehyde dehydrogenase n=1 Tax=Paracoccus siganidrum TaxID=1276757 RepID=A0A419AAD0_9RHOB|nr:NAD-dependent succinate-semialdehyde dehydrogenase [Paracoccus siganidrum]RJL19671.1 NAD-dependent succinate-semialdehyde dehydrogenase [Paracoccus siganidrum]RMC35945.1 NAD-dependent succinate-semialdehyde dehydrogenase [Paracoccus siganidrum]